MIGGDHRARALVVISHQGIERREAFNVLRRRWPDVVLEALGPKKTPGQ
jgi:hypothetical protein